MGHRQNMAADAACVDTRAHGINAPTDLITGHDRNWRQVRIEAHAAHDIREIDAARFDPNANFARLGRSGACLMARTSGGPNFVIQICRIACASALASLRSDLRRMRSATQPNPSARTEAMTSENPSSA